MSVPRFRLPAADRFQQNPKRGVVAMAAQGQQSAYFDELCAAVEQLGRLRWTLRLVIALADDANALTDEQLRTQLLTLAERTARLSAVANSPDP